MAGGGGEGAEGESLDVRSTRLPVVGFREGNDFRSAGAAVSWCDIIIIVCIETWDQ